MCVVLVYFLTLLYVHFRKFYAGQYIGEFVSLIKADRAQMKSGNGAIGYRRILP